MKNLIFAFGILLTFFFLAAGQIKPVSLTIKIVNIINLFSIGLFLFVRFRPKQFPKPLVSTQSLIAILILTFFVSSKSIIKTTQPDLLSEPPAESYRSDEKIFLKTFYLIEGGQTYYEAFKIAYREDLRFEDPPTDVFAWRLPAVFYFWFALASGGETIRGIFIYLCALTIVCAYLLARKLTSDTAAVLSSYLLIPYFLDALTFTSFLFTEWWGLFFFIFGLTAYFYNLRKPAYTLFILSVLTRELFILPLVAVALASTVKERKNYFLLILPVLFTLIYFIHFNQVTEATNANFFNLTGRAHAFSKDLTWHLLSFSTRLYQLSILRIGSLFFLLGTLGLLVTLLKKPNMLQKKFAFLAAASFLPFAALSPFLATADFTFNAFSDYWGAAFLPIAIIFSPTILNLFSKR